MSSSTSLPGARIGKYKVLAHIATGGMGTVYRARDTESDREVALKVLAPELADNPILVERFKREARAAALLEHKNIVQLYETGYADGLHYLAMEYIQGIDLSEYIKRKGQLDPEEARLILIQACKALAHAASQGITHRDIKPSNFLLANDAGRTRVKLTDLGLSRIDSEEDFRVTRAGTTVGTVDYMAPEQARDSGLADLRSDIYSLGCTFYHMLAGQPPFSEGGIGERVYKHIAVDPPDVREFNSDIPAGLWTVLRRMLAKHPDDRFQTPEELILALCSVNAPAEPPVTPSGRNAPPLAGEPDSTRPLPPVPEPTPSPAAPPPAERKARKRPSSGERPTTKERPSTQNDLRTVPDDPPNALGITPEMREAASKQYAHASEVVRSKGDFNYARQLLLSCCKLDPGNLMYRKMLREVVRDHTGRRKGGWFGSLTNLPARGRLKKSRLAGDYRKVLEEGEELLSKSPGDTVIQIEMALSAEGLGLPGLAVWMLEEAHTQDPKAPAVLRELGELHERQNRLVHAIAAWERLRELLPADHAVADKIRELSVNETLARGNFRR